MPTHSPILRMPASTQLRLNNITTCLTATANTLKILCDSFQTPFLAGISNTIQSLAKNAEGVKQHRNDCVLLMEQTHNVLNAIIVEHMKLRTPGEFPPSVLNQIGKFTETLQEIHTFVEAQQNGSKIKMFFHQGELNALLKECKAGLQQALKYFQVLTSNIISDIRKMQQEANIRHQVVLDMIEALSDTPISDSASSISGIYSRSYASSNSLSILPSEPKIFHGRESELEDILRMFSHRTPRIAVLGGAGMGKTSLARAVVHHPEISLKYGQSRFFVACDSAATKVELAGHIGDHLGLKQSKDLTQPIIEHLSCGPPSLLILDNLETLWEQVECHEEIEEFLCLLSGVDHLGLIITMCGAERPGKVRWTRPFLSPLEPLCQDAARQTFFDITDASYDLTSVDKVLSMTDNMPLAISLIAHLVDSDGFLHVLSRWEEEKTSLLSDGYNKCSNLNLSISLSISSPRIASTPDSKHLLSLLAILPDGLSDTELIQSQLPFHHILDCKAALIRTGLAYIDGHKQLKVLVPIREYIQKIQPPTDHMIQPLLAHFQELLGFHKEYFGPQSNPVLIKQISSNLSNIPSVIRNGLCQGHPDLKNSVYCAV
ncbi:P-loop containing nucleoside triphosphate hydrolase protein, partial [Mycena albidolilacea]